MKNYLGTKDVYKLLRISKSAINNYVKTGVFKAKKKDPFGKSIRVYTWEDIRQLALLRYGPIVTKEFIIKCPYGTCKKPMKVSLLYLAYEELKSKKYI